MLSKIIVYANSREEAINKMHAALREFEVEGIKTNKEFLVKILENKTFKSGKFDTSFVEKIINNEVK